MYRLVSRILCCAFVVLGLAVPSLQARSWTSSDGRSVEGDFVSLSGDSVKLKLTAGGRLVELPLSRLDEADQDTARRLAKIGDDTMVRAAAQKIDALLQQGFQKAKVGGFNEPVSDEVFARRIYLDVLGRAPTEDEWRALVVDTRPDKREILIDELLLLEGHSSHLFNYMADMFRFTAELNNGFIRFDPYFAWFKEQIRKNRPYDDLARELITASGNIGQNPATGFLLRDAGMELDAFANFGQVFLGTDISCAQCHDHPFVDWTQMDFFQMAAFFGSTDRIVDAKETMPGAPDTAGLADKLKAAAQTKGFGGYAFEQQANFLVRAWGWTIQDREGMELTLPDDFKESGGKPGETVRPRVLFGKTAKMGGMSRREALASWLTAPDNPVFATVIANRLWSRAFGRALVEPVIDVGDLSKTAQPEVVKFIGSWMQKSGYDLRNFERSLYYTRAYQSAATVEEPDLVTLYPFNGPLLRRMRAEQVWDSFVTLAMGPQSDDVRGPDGSRYAKILNVDWANYTMDDLVARAEEWSKAGGRRIALSGGGSNANGDMMNAGASMMSGAAGRGVLMARASENEQPAAGGSLLDTFGQSDRMVTDQHNFDGSVPQVLSLMNGALTSSFTSGGSPILVGLENFDTDQEKATHLFTRILCRKPDSEELAMAVKLMKEHPADAVGDLVWGLLNAPEFLFIQ